MGMGCATATVGDLRIATSRPDVTRIIVLATRRADILRGVAGGVAGGIAGRAKGVKARHTPRDIEPRVMPTRRPEIRRVSAVVVGAVVVAGGNINAGGIASAEIASYLYPKLKAKVFNTKSAWNFEPQIAPNYYVARLNYSF